MVLEKKRRKGPTMSRNIAHGCFVSTLCWQILVRFWTPCRRAVRAECRVVTVHRVYVVCWTDDVWSFRRRASLDVEPKFSLCPAKPLKLWWASRLLQNNAPCTSRLLGECCKRQQKWAPFECFCSLSLYVTTSKLMVIVWRLRGSIFRSTCYLFNGHN